MIIIIFVTPAQSRKEYWNSENCEKCYWHFVRWVLWLCCCYLRWRDWGM